MSRTGIALLEGLVLAAIAFVVFRYGDRWWERYRVGRPTLNLADLTFDQSHTWHALICALAGSGSWAAYHWHLGVRAFALGVFVTIAIYFVRELWWRIRDRFAPSRRFDRSEPLRWWDGILDVAKPLWAPGCFAAAVWFGAVPPLIVGTFAVLSCSIAYGYSFGRPAGALFYDGKY